MERDDSSVASENPQILPSDLVELSAPAAYVPNSYGVTQEETRPLRVDAVHGPGISPRAFLSLSGRLLRGVELSGDGEGLEYSEEAAAALVLGLHSPGVVPRVGPVSTLVLSTGTSRVTLAASQVDRYVLDRSEDGVVELYVFPILYRELEALFVEGRVRARLGDWTTFVLRPVHLEPLRPLLQFLPPDDTRPGRSRIVQVAGGRP